MSEEIRRVIELLADGVIEVRALADGATHSGYFDDHTLLAGQVEALDADPTVAGIYVTLNAVNPALLARRANRIKMRLGRKDATTADADILRRRWLPVDIDPVRPSGVSSTETEHAEALNAAERIAAYLKEQGFPAPVRADSGNGAHLLYRIDLPNDDPSTALVKNCLATLDALFSNETVTVDTANHNAARIWKLYGTLSRKGDNTVERPHRRAKVLSAPEKINLVPVERLERLAGLLPREITPKKKAAGIDLAAWLAEHGIAVRSTRPYQGGTLFTLAECPFSSAHKDGAFAIQFANGAVFAGCHHQTCGGGAQRWPELRRMYEKASPKKREAAVSGIKEEAPALLPDELRERALAILRDGDPLAFLLETFNKAHVGDRTVAECLVMSLASQSVENTNGLHVSISGNSGKGKSHACVTMLRQVPAEYRLAGTVSDKALYYNDNLHPGTVFLFDDVSLSDDLQEVLKSATANFREPIEHQTVTSDRKLQICRIPERCVWWLAKVEDPGDDQVMNRMLTVWIDDSAEQDARVLEHLKRVEAREGAGDEQEHDDLLTARAIWMILKEKMLHVSVPYARSIQFSSAGNRRNPGFLFDLIKCHALLFRFQREESSGGIRATRDDFAAAARLYGAINGEAGGQETKLTKNEAAALATVVTMGWGQFTVRMLQEALGLSYQQTYRILHGYVSRGATYSGLLEKCPAVSYVDAQFTEDACGCTVRRREHLFSFDLGVYRQWSRGAEVWLDDGEDRDGGPDPGDSFSITAGLEQDSSRCCKDRSPPNDAETEYTGTERDASLSIDRNIQQTRDPHSSTGSRVFGGVRVCESRDAVTTTPMPPETPPNGDSRNVIRPFDFNGLRNLQKITERRGGLLETGAGGTVPLPGVLNPGMFERVRAEIGRCDICDNGKAVYRSREAQTNICEGCYARLVRERNGRAGVRCG